MGGVLGAERQAKMKLKVVCRKVFNYVRYDLKEIAFPSFLPYPPHLKKRPELTCKERYHVLKEASPLYAASWVRDIGPELRPNDYRTKEEDGDMFNAEKRVPKESINIFIVIATIAVAARGGMGTLKPTLQRVYMTRASSYRDALRSFIEGYQEDISQQDTIARSVPFTV
ncbi:uncharacterized protein [Primulina eburnea]|uniref:uncharacterized protein n=1 Tax=Primulina eburnea TaxID=1245227 RepID=UPI003C6BFDD4